MPGVSQLGLSVKRLHLVKNVTWKQQKKALLKHILCTTVDYGLFPLSSVRNKGPLNIQHPFHPHPHQYPLSHCFATSLDRHFQICDRKKFSLFRCLNFLTLEISYFLDTTFSGKTFYYLVISLEKFLLSYRHFRTGRRNMRSTVILSGGNRPEKT